MSIKGTINVDKCLQEKSIMYAILDSSEEGYAKNMIDKNGGERFLH